MQLLNGPRQAVKGAVKAKTTFLAPLLRAKAPDATVRNRRNGRLLASRVLPAFDSQSRRTGLLRHETLPDGHAMLIAPSNAVHTFFMRFPIDLAFLDRQGRIVATRASVAPWRLAVSIRAFAVLEMPAGTLARSQTIMGDMLEIRPPVI